MRLIAAFMVAVLSVSAFGQSCERTVPVSSAIPGYSIQGLTVTDFQATLLNDAVDEYLVTVAVPDIALDQKARWQLRRSNEVKTPPANQ
jgi:hypothetical protein